VSLAPDGCTCGLRRPRCPACITQIVYWLGGAARCRGEDWAKAVAAKVGTGQDWPPYEGRCAEIARERVAYLDREDRGVNDALAREAHEQAAYTWAKLRGR
jgi:hypothetical protein